MDNRFDNNNENGLLSDKAPQHSDQSAYPGQPGAPGIVSPRQPRQPEAPHPGEANRNPYEDPAFVAAYGAPVTHRRGSRMAWVIGGAVVLLLIIGGAAWWYFGSYKPAQAYAAGVAAAQHTVATATNPKGIDLINREGSPVAQARTINADGTVTTEADGATGADVAAAYDDSQLIDRVLNYSGTITPGGKASLSLTLFRNGRIEGTLSRSGGKEMEISGSYDITDESNPRITLSFTALPADQSDYSESWKGNSSAIADDLSHNLSFDKIYSSKGDSYTASFKYNK